MKLTVALGAALVLDTYNGILLLKVLVSWVSSHVLDMMGRGCGGSSTALSGYTLW